MGISFKKRMEIAFPVWSTLLKRSKPFVRSVIVAGAGAGAVTVTDIKKGDQLVSVFESATSTAVLTDLTSEFVANTDAGWIVRTDAAIDNTGGTATTGDTLLVTWIAWGA